MRCIPHPICILCATALLLVAGASDVQAQSIEYSNGCTGTQDNPCVRTGQCAIQGSVWGQQVTIDRTDTFDTQGWAGLCDMVHVALLQGNCSPPGGDQDITVTLSATSYAVIDSITGPLRCAGGTANALVGATRTGKRLTAYASPSSAVSTIGPYDEIHHGGRKLMWHDPEKETCPMALSAPICAGTPAARWGR